MALTLTEVEIDAYELSAFSRVRNTTLADSKSDIVSWLTESLSEAQGMALDNAAFNGDGTSTYGYCSGLLSAAAGYSVVMSSGSTNFSSITSTNLSEIISKLSGLRKIGAKFYMHGEILHYARSLLDTNNRPIFIETIGSRISPTIWGYPYKEVTQMPSTSAANTAFMVFGNLGKHFGVGRRLNATTLSVDPYGLWTTNRTRFKLYSRFGLKIVLANGIVRILTNSA